MRQQMIFVVSFNHHPTLSRVMIKKAKKGAGNRHLFEQSNN